MKACLCLDERVVCQRLALEERDQRVPEEEGVVTIVEPELDSLRYAGRCLAESLW